VVAGIRSAFASPGNQQGGWIFRIIHGKPPGCRAALHLLQGGPLWTFAASGLVVLGAIGFFQCIAPAELRNFSSLSAQVVIGLGLCLLLTDAFFLNVTTVPFTGERPARESNLAFTVLRYYTFFPLVTGASVAFELLLEPRPVRMGIAIAAFAVAHLWLRKCHRSIIRLDCSQIALEEGEDEFPMKLGLRY
jgi:hypothetical protein